MPHRIVGGGLIAFRFTNMRIVLFYPGRRPGLPPGNRIIGLDSL